LHCIYFYAEYHYAECRGACKDISIVKQIKSACKVISRFENISKVILSLRITAS
jgi:hypothetical protein